MNDLRTQLPQCPLEYQVPHIPGSHTALVIEINTADIDWQEKMLPWTLASLINNTDLVMKGVHLYVVCEDNDTHARAVAALKNFDLPTSRYANVLYSTILHKEALLDTPLRLFGKYGHGYDSVCLFDINYWAFRGIGKAQGADIKLPLGHILRHTYSWAVADYSFNPANDIYLKDTWVSMSRPLRLTGGDSPKRRKLLAGALVEASAEQRTSVAKVRTEGNGLVHRRRNKQDPDFSDERAHWLHDANRAVYGEDYKKQNKNISAHFLNETEPNWHLDASILHYSASEVNNYFSEWAPEWQHLGTEPLIALWLLKTQQHAHNLSDSVMIERNYIRTEYPRLCNMQFAETEQFNYAMTELMGAQLNIKM